MIHPSLLIWYPGGPRASGTPKATSQGLWEEHAGSAFDLSISGYLSFLPPFARAASLSPFSLSLSLLSKIHTEFVFLPPAAVKVVLSIK